MSKLLTIVVALAGTVVMPGMASAQGSITGVVKDTSGAVLPGVTAEAASPALIEKVRSVATDGTGQYRIENLRPGVYTVTFTLPGFATVRREGIELTGTFSAAVNAELRVGAVEETITVTGETPVVDVQSATRQRVMDREILDSIPSGRNEYNLGVLIPGVTVTGGHDVGGSGGQSAFPTIGIHGSTNEDQVQTIAGMRVTNMATSGSHQPIRVNPAGTQEITMDTAAGDAQQAAGGVRIDRLPREGSNTFNGTFFGTFANSSTQGSNLTQGLRDRGFRIAESIDRNWEVNPGFGGPIMRDRLWFYFAAMKRTASLFAPGLFQDRNVNNPNAWTFDPDVSQPVTQMREQKDGQINLTWQATPKNKIAFTVQNAVICFCPQDANSTNSLEAAEERSYPLRRFANASWTAPVTSRLLLEASGVVISSISNDFPRPWVSPEMIGVEEQSTGLEFRAGSSFRHRPDRVLGFQGVASYITGAHAFKVGIHHRSGREKENRFDLQPLNFRFNNGVPNQLTQRALPVNVRNQVDHELGLFAQDKWTVGGLTLSYGGRYDYFANSFPEQHVGPARLVPTRDFTLPAQQALAYHDVSPRLGVAYDPFGTGKTAVKVSLNKYLVSLGAGGFAAQSNPTNNLIVETTRSWRDANGDFVPDCDLLNSNANGECGRMANTAFGLVGSGRGRAGRGQTATYDPDLLRGWFRRNYNWEFSAGVQHEVVPRVAAEVGYFRRTWGNFTATDNRATTPADFDPFSITAPGDPRLPGGGGFVVSDLYDLNPAKFGVPVDNFVTRAENFGKQEKYWHGVDVSLNARPRPGLLLSGGLSTGRTVTDKCDIVTKLDNPSTLYCHVATDFLTQIKFLGSYTIPRIDLQVSGAFQSLPGPEIVANFNAPNAQVAPSLGRSLSGGARNVRVNLVEPGTLYGERLNQLDLRVAKILRVGRTRTMVGLDLFNALNSNAVIRENSNFGAFRQPTQILLARFVKLSAQFDF